MDIKKPFLRVVGKIDGMEKATDAAIGKLAAHEHTARWVVIGVAVLGLVGLVLLVRGCAQ